MNLIELRKAEKKTDGVPQFIEGLFTSCSNHTLQKQQDWYLNERFIRGEHWVVYNKTENRIMPLPTKKGNTRRTVNKIRTQVRGVKNFIKRSQPRFEAHPNEATDEAYEAARKTNKILQNFYRKKNFKTLMTDVITNSMKFSIGIIEGGVTEKKGKTDIDFWIDDTFEVVFDTTATSPHDARFYIKAKPMPLTTIKSLYGVDVKADNKSAASEYKSLLKDERTNGETKGAKDLETAIVKELWMKWEDENGDLKMKKITVSGKQTLDVEMVNYRRYPLFTYCAEREVGVMYPDSWVKDLISPNKSLDKTVSAVESYVQQMLAGKWMIKKGVEVSTITDNGSEKIYYNGSVPPTQMALQSLPGTVFTYINGLESWIEEFGGMRAASLGRNPGSLQSGKALEALQSADAGVVAEPIENMEILLSQMGEFILEVIEDYQIGAQTIMEEKEDIRYIGAGVEEEVGEGTLKITSSEVKVVIVPEVAYTEEAKLGRLMQLAEAGIIDPETILEKLNFSNISDVVARMKVIKEQQMQEEMVKQRESHRTDGGGAQDSAQLADQENTGMLAGQEVPMTPQSLWIPEHLALHMAFLQENAKDISANPEAQAAFEAHINNENNYQQNGGGQPQQQ